MENIEIKIKDSLTDEALEILNVLNEDGYSAFAVGGCIRDCLLGNIPKDEDITTVANPETVKDIMVKNGFKVFDSGIEFGTITAVKNNKEFEITTFRNDGEYKDNRKPQKVKFVDNINDDLKRRDFTINAMAWSPKDGFVDNFNGIKDLDEGKITCVGEADKRIKEDALRMMRAVRFSARFGFDMDEELIQAIINNSENINSVSKERISSELQKTLMTDNPMYVKKYHELGIMKEILPEVDDLFEVEQNTVYHLYDVGNHTIKTLENSPKDKNLRMALLLHDVGKIDTKTTDENGDHFFNHAKFSYEKSKKILKDLKFTKKEVKDISNLVLYHDELNDIGDSKRKSIRKRVRNFVIEHQDLEDSFYKNFIDIKICDVHGQNQENEVLLKKISKMDDFKEIIETILDGPHKKNDLEVNGLDLKKIGYVGKEIPLIQDRLLIEVIDNPKRNDKELLIKFAEGNYKGITGRELEKEESFELE